MEGGVNPKNMARSKRASSQRSKAKHSKHTRGGGQVAAVTREKTVSEDSLPSNWERYGDESGSDENLAPLNEGEVRPKSKGADYRELLSSDVPQLFDEPPEMEGMTAMLLSNGLGLWDWDSSYLEPASLSLQRQAAREASALLTVDLRLLGESISRLSMAQRLFLEDELFVQEGQLEGGLEAIDTSARISDSAGAAPPIEDGPHDHQLRDTSLSPRNEEVSAKSHSGSSKRYATDYEGAAETSSLGVASTKPPAVSTPYRVSESTSGEVSSISAQVADTTGTKKGSSREPVKGKRFEATAAEAELDDLLDMLDNEVAGISLKKGGEGNPPRPSTAENSSLTSAFPASSRPAKVGFPESKVETRPRDEATPIVPGPAPKLAATPSPLDSGVRPEKIDSSSSATATDVTLSQDDDFDSWLDSI